MKNYLLNNNVGIEFSLFSITHLTILFITFFIVIFMIFNKKKISNISLENKKKIRIAIGILLLFTVFVRRGSFIYYGVYNWKRHLDLGFCNITNLIFIFYCFTGNKKIYNICYYFIFAGPLLAMVFPSVTVSINNFSFLAFVIMHYGIFAFNILFAIFENKQYKFKEAMMGIGIGNIYLLITIIFNLFFKTSYNRFGNFISDALYNNNFIMFLNRYELLNTLFLMLIGSFVSFSGMLILKYLNSGGNFYEEK